MTEAGLKSAAAEIRKLTITALESAGYGHIGGSMSICDVLAVLYCDIMNIDPDNPLKEDRDRLVLSKGHCGPALYATLAYKNYFPKEELLTLNGNGTKLPSHCDRLKTRGVDISTGSLGQGYSLAAGVAYGSKLRGLNNYCYCIVGDGELQEGQNWEAIQFACHHNLDNLILIVDNNKRQLDGYTAEICAPHDIAKKLAAFGLKVFEADGHDVMAIRDALTMAKAVKAPSAVILDTQKGYGCIFAEIEGFNHYMVVTPEAAEAARKEIDRRLKA
ncbi:MAG: transketolase [Christensenellales bacterium]|jgi:transketolase